MATQDMAFRFVETSSTVDTIQHVVGRQNVTRQPKTLHDMKVGMAQTKQESCDTIGFVGKHKKFHSSTAHIID